MRTGAGGYGGSSTMNQDQRGGKWHPHNGTSQYRDRMTNKVLLKCVVCKAEWTLTDEQYFKRETGDMPSVCTKNLSRTPDA